MQDEAIVELYLKRDESAISETRKKYDRYLKKVAYNILGDISDSEESVSDTYLAAWNSIPPHKPQVLSTYLAKLTRRLSIDIFRRRSRGKRRSSEYAVSLSELEDCLPDRNTPENDADLHLLADAIGSYLQTVSAVAKDAFIGRYWFSDSIRDISAYLGISQSKTKSLLFRTRAGLKRYLEKEDLL